MGFSKIFHFSVGQANIYKFLSNVEYYLGGNTARLNTKLVKTKL